MKILVCGHNGFMGRNIYEHFKSKNKAVSGVSSEHDLTRISQINHVFDMTRPDVIIQAAATTSGAKDIVNSPYLHVTDNAVMNSLLLRACYEWKIKHFIFLSCGVMYQPGDTPKKEDDFNESDEIFPKYFGVGWTKVYIEKMMEFYAGLGRTKHTAIRHSNTYGPYDKFDLEKSHVFGATMRKVLDAEDSITVWGNGTETGRDLVYVQDVVDFIELAINKQEKQFDLVNVGLGRYVLIKELVEKIVKASGKDLEIKYDPDKPVIPTKLALDCTKAKEEYGWEPKVDLDDGIERTLKWLQANYPSKKK